MQFPYVQTDNVGTFLKSKSNLIQKETERRRSFIAWHLDPVITFQDEEKRNEVTCKLNSASKKSVSRIFVK